MATDAPDFMRSISQPPSPINWTPNLREITRVRGAVLFQCPGVVGGLAGRGHSAMAIDGPGYARYDAPCEKRVYARIDGTSREFRACPTSPRHRFRPTHLRCRVPAPR